MMDRSCPTLVRHASDMLQDEDAAVQEQVVGVEYEFPVAPDAESRAGIDVVRLAGDVHKRGLGG